MAIGRRLRGYTARSWTVAAFLLLAFVLGGGEAKNPAAELILQLLFAAFALAWLWLPQNDAPEQGRETWLIGALAALVVIVPLLQLVPLPPSIWQALPGREAQVAALDLVGAADTWRPISAVPRRTIASLLAVIPAVGVMVAVSRMDLHDRTLVPATVLVAALATVALGVGQLASPDGGLQLHSQIHAGWITGFQSNRNHAAEVLLVGIVSLAVLTKLAIGRDGKRLPRDLSPRVFALGALGLALILAAALVMTGSRSGILLALVAGAGSVLVLQLPSGEGPRSNARGLLIVLGCLAAFAVLTYLFYGPGNTSIGRVAERFGLVEDNRERIWGDAVFAWRQLWPVGIGAGGFMAAMFPAERLEFLDATYPNQAHNDFLEIGIEGGLAAYLVLVAVALCLAALAMRHWRTARSGDGKVQIVFAATVLIMFTLHSVVDYPLRSMSLACLAGAACGLLSRANVRPLSGRSKKSKGH